MEKNPQYLFYTLEMNLALPFDQKYPRGHKLLSVTIRVIKLYAHFLSSNLYV